MVVDPNLVLAIVKLSLEIWLEVLKDMPAGERAAAWKRHQEFIEFWQTLLPKKES